MINRTNNLKKYCIIFLTIFLILFITFLVYWFIKKEEPYVYKIKLIKNHISMEQIEATINESSNVTDSKVVFISICNAKERARVFSGTDKKLSDAWKKADNKVQQFLKNNDYDVVWVKVDIIYTSLNITSKELSQKLTASRDEFFRYGISFDENYETALLEAELNGAKIYDYDNHNLDLTYLNNYLKKSNRDKVDKLPEKYIVFQCQGYICDEDNKVYELNSKGLEYGRRTVNSINDEYSKWLIDNSANFLMNQVKEDGSFIYGIYPRFNNEIENYNIVRHASTIWSLICYYRLEPSEELKEIIDKTIMYMLNYVIYSDENTAYLYEEKSKEIKLGGCGIAVVVLTEYMDVFQNDNYKEVCKALGNGILTMFNKSTGKFYHVLNEDFSQKEEFRTVYYDGEAAFALSRLYGLTNEQIWIDSAQTAVNYFIENDYTKYKDHWIAYTMNEITKYIDNSKYYEFALKNAQENLVVIHDRDTTYHTYLELLMATFEVYDRMIQKNIEIEYLNEFNLNYFIETIFTRVDRMLNGFFYPEYAMYMANPERILYTFMIRHDGYRIRIDDEQHNIDGYYQFYKNYNKILKYNSFLNNTDAMQHSNIM